jgi:hypothetical protein
MLQLWVIEAQACAGLPYTVCVRRLFPMGRSRGRSRGRSSRARSRGRSTAHGHGNGAQAPHFQQHMMHPGMVPQGMMWPSRHTMYSMGPFPGHGGMDRHMKRHADMTPPSVLGAGRSPDHTSASKSRSRSRSRSRRHKDKPSKGKDKRGKPRKGGRGRHSSRSRSKGRGRRGKPRRSSSESRSPETFPGKTYKQLGACIGQSQQKHYYPRRYKLEILTAINNDFFNPVRPATQ